MDHSSPPHIDKSTNSNEIDLYLSDILFRMPLPWNDLSVRLSINGRVRCEPGWGLNEAWSANLRDFDLWLVSAGRGRMFIDGQSHPLGPGTCLWMRPGHLYLADQDLNRRLRVTYIHFDLLDGDGSRVDAASLPPILRPLPDLAYVVRVTERIVELSRGSEPQRQTATQLLRGLLMDLDSPIQPSGSKHAINSPQHLAAMRTAAMIREQPGQPWNVQTLAEEAGYCPDHFTRIFSAVHEQTPREFVISARIERAQQLMRETDLSIKKIANVLGYSSVFFFSRQFRDKAGVPPAQWRSALR